MREREREREKIGILNLRNLYYLYYYYYNITVMLFLITRNNYNIYRIDYEQLLLLFNLLIGSNLHNFIKSIYQLTI